MADGGAIKTRPQVILSAEPARGGDREGPALMDWKARFGRRSPLSRKIITFNLVALGVLLTGVLYLNQFQGGLVEMRARALVTEGRLVATVLSDRLGGRVDGLKAIDALVTVQGVTSARLMLFDAQGRLVTRVDSGGPAPAGQAIDAPPVQSQPPSAFISIMGQLWDRASRVFAAREGEDFAALSLRAARPLAEAALAENRIVRSTGATQAGDQVLSVALPVPGPEGTALGALVLTTAPGDVDAVIRAEREKILQVFALAIISSIVLSLVLANTIVRPLRDLSEAAHEGGTRNAQQLNPERINIPDMTGRPDEIGYLSGAMRLMTRALFDRIEANESFAADVAHEIKNPLTSLRSAVETFPYAKTDESREKLLNVIKNDVDRLDRLVTDISNASRLDSELVRDRMEPFDLHGLLANLISFNEKVAAAAGARLVADFPEAPLRITGLEGRLAQVFVNLITNAVSFASEGDAITVRTQAEGRKVRVTVDDQGPGIPDGNLADVFERFYSERPQKEEFGNHSGLGLAISRQIVEAHGGEIWAENIRPEGAGQDRPPDGARFVVVLPV
ncbi:HAMP domain-containing protein [Rhodobacteraceae bacterium 2CG4]|uniref:histidine kinase n=1 Tax=Halovulum marinum TaxID=2662447 RepID=A0A6L5YV22_9RHOB|nr:sensor histidine kinase [Halovulum marinum]MSU88131.1 HAMP domain-containing protein [Halovulum marinum]